VRAAPLAAGVVFLVLCGLTARAAVREVDASPGIAQWSAAIATSPAPQREQEERLIALLQQGDDAAALAHVRSLGSRQPALAATLHETLAGVYVRERRLYRATLHLEAIPAARRSDQALYLLASIAARQQRLEAALTQLESLARRVPEDPLVARDEAQVASLLGRHAQAAAACERLLRRRPGDGEAVLLLARARMKQGRLPEAERLLDGLLAHEPRNGRAALQRGFVQLLMDKPRAARESFARARSIETRDATPYAAEAAAALLLGDRPAARVAAAGALRQNPADPLAGLLDLLARDGAWPAAVPGGARSLAASLYPDLETEPPAAALKAELAAPATGRTAVANLLLEKVSAQASLAWIAAEPAAAGGPLAALTEIRALLAAGQPQPAGTRLAALERSAAARGLLGPAVLAAVLASQRNDRAAAQAAMRRAVALAPQSPRLRMLAGDLYLVLGEPTRAVAEYRVAQQHWPRDPRLLNQLAYAIAQVGGSREREEALAHTETALRQKPHYLLRAALLDTRADLLLRQGRTAEALAAYRELSTTVGGMTGPEQWHRLGDLATRAGDLAEARRAYEEALDYGRAYPGRAVAVERVDARAPNVAQK
jgi:tetratricopeptide (TPR) repeat protein